MAGSGVCKEWPTEARRDASGKQIGSGPHTLTAEQLTLFEEAKKKCGKLDDSMRMSDDDLLMRFFIGRDFKVDPAVQAAQDSVKWRKANNVENIFEWSEKTMQRDVIFKSHTKGLCGFYGFDNEGYPIWWERPNQTGIGELLKQYGRDDCLRWHVCVVERCREVAKSLRMDRVTMVLDLSDVTGSVLFSKAGGLLKAQAKQDQEVYPECLRKMYLINAPWGFSAAWSALKPFLNARTQDKITIQSTRQDGDPLSQYVSKGNIPVDFGGDAVVDWDVTRMIATKERRIFKPKIYLDRIKEFEKTVVEPKEEEEEEVPLPRHVHGHHGQDGDVAHTDILLTCLTYVSDNDDVSTVPPTPPPREDAPGFALQVEEKSQAKHVPSDASNPQDSSPSPSGQCCCALM
eukprot:TRINITY_DN3998_c0_g8_i1.p1 TRINITY_DN3998_c0_g8~~TRINITY_DN3998_c0_g8_i1.p1  ORF type:complete len:402 (+),score=63.36 TRINITY_DN3998_c0_g8_i1:92-1297(+)